MKRIIVLAVLALSVAACEDSRSIEVRQANGTMKVETVRCVGVSGKGKKKGIDYDWSGQNVAVGLIFSEIIIPPIMVLSGEFFCPIADTTTAPTPK